MIDDNLFEFLHMTIINHLATIKKSKEELKETIEEIGYRVGYGLIEKITSEVPRLTDEVSIMKFICKEFWLSIFNKQIDNLKTNNQGTFVLQDNNYRFLSQLSNGIQYLQEADKYIYFGSGLLRGALSNFGYSKCKVNADIYEQIPVVKFTIILQ